MNKENQIDEMAKDMCEYYYEGTCYQDKKPCDCKCDIFTDAQYLYSKGYRKSTDIAEEIFDEFHNMLLKFVSDFDDGLEKANDKATTVVLDCARETILLVILYLAGLKKKYTQEK